MALLGAANLRDIGFHFSNTDTVGRGQQPGIVTACGGTDQRKRFLVLAILMLWFAWRLLN